MSTTSWCNMSFQLHFHPSEPENTPLKKVQVWTTKNKHAYITTTFKRNRGEHGCYENLVFTVPPNSTSSIGDWLWVAILLRTLQHLVIPILQQIFS